MAKQPLTKYSFWILMAPLSHQHSMHCCDEMGNNRQNIQIEQTNFHRMYCYSTKLVRNLTHSMAFICMGWFQRKTLSRTNCDNNLAFYCYYFHFAILPLNSLFTNFNYLHLLKLVAPWAANIYRKAKKSLTN